MMGQEPTAPGDRDSAVVVQSIGLSGNKITRERIIYREILFRVGDTLTMTQLRSKTEQSRKNLVNTSLFNFVTADIKTISGEAIIKAEITFTFIERWYIWPVPILEFADRNFNEWLKKKDWNRLNYGMFLTWNNFRGRREKVVVYTRFGYDENYNVSYQIPYINKKQTLGIGFAGGFSQNHEIAYNSEDNKEVYFKNEDYYPQKTYFGFSEVYYRKSIHNFHRGMVGYTDLRVADSVIILNPDFAFGNATRNQFMTLFYHFRTDFRDYKQYPLNGYYFDVDIEKKGLGFFDAGVNVLQIKPNIRKYEHLKGRFYWASGLSGKVSPFWDQPYYYMQGLGYGRDYVRGYEYYVIDGQHFALLKNNLKFELVKMREMTFPFIPTDKFNKLFYAFYLNVYADLGYVFDNRNVSTNPLSNEILTGYGVGLDFVTYYDFVLRLEYSFNKMGESGFFISFMPSI
jgi:outer membrane protein assembly factor BamA